ncbi:hypothetical protein D3C80_1244090 [compost metagenome]
MYDRSLREDFHNGKGFCVIDGHCFGKRVGRPDLMMDIVNADAEDANLLTLFVFRQRGLRFDSQRSSVQSHQTATIFRAACRGHKQLPVGRNCRLVSPLTDGNGLQTESLRIFRGNNLGQFQHDLRYARGILRDGSEEMKASSGVSRNG